MSKMKRLPIILLLIALATLLGCSAQTDYSGKVKVVFELEGGAYQNCDLPIVCYYDFDSGTANLIKQPTAFSNAELTRSGYTLEGWYQTRTENGETVAYSDKWDFETDKVSDGGVTLYACWRKNIKYTYNVCYRDDEGALHTIGSYTVDEGEKFDDYARYANKRFGYTALEYLDEEGSVWNSSFTHPGGETDTAVNVVVNYIEGTYSVVRTAKELKAATSANIYLMDDIDMDGGTLSFGGYNKIFLGNGHTVSNFKVAYGKSKDDLIDDYGGENLKVLSISLFGNLNGATVKDVTFTGVTVDVDTTYSLTKKIYVMPLFAVVTKSSIENVSAQVTYTCTRLPSGFDAEADLIYITDRAYYSADATSTFTEVGAEVNASK